MIIQICVGSSCHIKGSADIVELLQKAVQDYRLEGDVTLAGSFCTGQCNRVGVTIQVDDDIYPGITREGFQEFFHDKILRKLRGERV
ncbi:MAG: (2Fe-2S) ferredoxin domain-containing protein [Clostridia bacterium]|nr:(2Fe-2S) ferredoxin domain-containing protein [Clostridia bacterium]